MSSSGWRESTRGRAGALAVVTAAGDASFATDLAGFVLAWNEAATEAFGYTCDQAMGQPCHQLLRGLDLFGNRFCGATCALRGMIQSGDKPRTCELVVHDSASRPVLVRVTPLVLPGCGTRGPVLVHLVSQKTWLAGAGAAPDGQRRRSSAATPNGPLSHREGEVLDHLGRGRNTVAIARAMGISRNTVRSHVESLLHKLGVNSRLEAVAAGKARGLL